MTECDMADFSVFAYEYDKLLESLTLFTPKHFNDMMVLEDIRTNDVANLTGTIERLAAIMDSVSN